MTPTGDYANVYITVGGLVGSNSGVINASFAIGKVNPIHDEHGRGRPGGLVSENFGVITVSYWNTGTSGLSAGVGNGEAQGASGKITAELQAPTGYTGIYSTWGDTEAGDVWDFGSGRQYPVLKGISLAGQPTPTPAPTPPEENIGGYAAHPDDVAALTALYESTGGPNWTNDDNWLTTASLDQWEGCRE